MRFLAALVALLYMPRVYAECGIFFSEYVEGLNNNKALELFNGGDSACDLSDVRVQMYFNGATAPTLTVSGLTGGPLLPGGVYVITQSTADDPILLAQADFVSTTAGWFNGNDALVLLYEGVRADIFGTIGNNPGTNSGWGGSITKDHTLRRKSTVTGGNLAGIAGGPIFNPSVEWDVFAQNVFTGLGSHSTGAPPGGSGDPWMVGFQQQRFFFDGEDAKWYNCISDPLKQLTINMRMSYREGFGTFTDGMGIVVYGAKGVKHTISLAVVVAKDDFSPTCDSYSDVCLGNGAIAFEIDGEVVKEPGHIVVEEGAIEILAVNAPFGCKRVPDAHFHWEEQVAHIQMVRMEEEKVRSRKLQADNSNGNVLSKLMDPTVPMFNDDECADWVQERLIESNAFVQTGAMSTIFIETPAFTLRVEYTMNEDTTTWVKHHRLDWFLADYNPFADGAGGALVGGVVGETGKIKLDRTGLPILGDRYSILSHGKDSDYEVKSAFAEDFVAKPSQA